jgi:transcriptional regulator with XRE-family HTH domain
MARMALGWGVRDLARAAEVSPDTIARFERGDTLKEITVEVIQRTLERAGVVFIGANGGGPGVRLERGCRAPAEQLSKCGRRPSRTHAA